MGDYADRDRSGNVAAMTVTSGRLAVVLASQFDEEFMAWFPGGASDAVIYIVVILAVIGIVLKATT